MVYQELDINLFNSSGPPQWAYITQGDTTFGGFKFNVINGNEYWDIPGGITFYLNGSRPDGHVFSYPCTWSGHTVTCPVQASMSDYYGEVPCVLEAYSGSTKVGSQRVVVFVNKNPLSNVRLTSNDFKTLEQAIAAAASIPNINFAYNSSSENLLITRY